MNQSGKMMDLTLGGGGVRGIAYLGALEEAENRNLAWRNISGVSAGALVGALSGAGYKVSKLKELLDGFDFGQVELKSIPQKVPAVARFIEFCKSSRFEQHKNIEFFLKNRDVIMKMTSSLPNVNREFSIDNDFYYAAFDYRCNLIKNAVKYSKEGSLLNGDYIEEWVYSSLLKLGVKYFGDLKGGVVSKENPAGYKVRMTAVDSSRGKVIVLPDDIAFYGINPDSLEVAKAVRMSTSVPFAFKPVEIKKTEGGVTKTYHIVDGGVLDNFPDWLHNIFVPNTSTPVVGFKLVGRKALLSLDAPFTILQNLVTATHDIGVPKGFKHFGYVKGINTSEVSFLDFSLSEKDKQYLYLQGKKAGKDLFDKIETARAKVRRRFFFFPPRWFYGK